MPAVDHTGVKTNPKARGRRLKSLRKMADLSRKAMTLKYQISASTIQAWEEGKSGGLTTKGAQRIVAALKEEGVFCTLDWLLRGEGQSPYLTERVYLGVKEPASEFLNTVTFTQANIIAKELNIFRSLNQDVLDMVINDDGMYPFYQKEDIIAGKRYQDDDIDAFINRDCIIETRSGEILCRRLRPSKKSRHYHLQCIYLDTTVSEPLRYEVEILSVAPVIWHRRQK
jgi:transcriptional regulator with XRE-family HTH domain